MVAAFGPVFQYAADMGMHVYLLTDMLAVSPPLEAYLERTVGGLDVDDPALWSVYQAGLSELFDSMPFVDGLMVRIGEGGSVYQAGWDYSSKLAVTSRDLRAGHAARPAGDRRRPRPRRSSSAPGPSGSAPSATCTPTRTRTTSVLGGIDDPHLIVSTKYTMGDFYSHLPLNPTLETGTQRRIVEFQARREFEGFGALPNDLVAEQGQALQQLPRRQPARRGHLELDAGRRPAARRSDDAVPADRLLADVRPQHLRGRRGWRGTRRPTPAQVTADWVRQTLSSDPATVGRRHRRARRGPGRRSRAACTSGRSPSRASRRSASSRRR